MKTHNHNLKKLDELCDLFIAALMHEGQTATQQTRSILQKSQDEAAIELVNSTSENIESVLFWGLLSMRLIPLKHLYKHSKREYIYNRVVQEIAKEYGLTANQVDNSIKEIQTKIEQDINNHTPFWPCYWFFDSLSVKIPKDLALAEALSQYFSVLADFPWEKYEKEL